MPPLAIITMVYNEAIRIPYWLAHYKRQVGLQHCYVVDHGSTDGSTKSLQGANKIRLPRSPQDNPRRTAFISDLTSGLLRYYSRVAYVDADELLVAEPGRFADLNDYASRMEGDAVTSIGLEVVQAPDDQPLDASRGIGEQRSSVLFSSSMCKTNMVGRRVNWAPGWHSHDGRPSFDGLYLFHLRHADLGQALERLEITRNMPWSDEKAGLHQRVEDDWMRRVLLEFGRRPLAEGSGLLDRDGPLAEDLAAFLADSREPGDPRQPYGVPLARYGKERIPLEPAFRKVLSEV